MATSSETLQIRLSVLHGDMLPLVGLKFVAKWMTLSAYRLYFVSKCVYELQDCRALTALTRLSCYVTAVRWLNLFDAMPVLIVIQDTTGYLQ